MVKYLCFFILTLGLFFSGSLHASRVVVSGEIDGTPVAEKPIRGIVTINHTKDQKVDLSSFHLGDESLKVEFVKDVLISPRASEVFTVYHFTLDPKPVGLHKLPEVSVNVGGEVYRSIQSTYQVEEMSAETIPQPYAQTQSQSVSTELILKLETIVDGGPVLYPGQRIRVGYRYIYNYSMELQKEVIPLLQDEGFRRIGGKDRKESQQGNESIVEVTQVIEAVKPGEYSFAGGDISGRAYRLDKLGRKDYAKVVSSAVSAPAKLIVQPFPVKGKPSSFKGAIGENLKYSVELESSSKITVGDKIALLISISGQGQFANMPMPEVCCQPGFEGVFRQSDLAPEEEVLENKKTFRVEMRPLSQSITKIPPLEFSYFNPKRETYQTLTSQAIPLTIETLGAPSRREEPKTVEKPSLGTIEIEGNVRLTLGDLQNLNFGTWWVLLALPVGILVLLAEQQMHRIERRKKFKHVPITSDEVFQRAMAEEHGSAEFYQGLQEAFMLRLTERGEIEGSNVSMENFPNKEVELLFRRIQKERFSGQPGETVDKLIEDAKALFTSLERRKG